MLSLFLALAVVTSHSNQILAGPAFERFAELADGDCPSRRLQTITPGDLSWEEETFEDQLRPVEVRRLAALNLQDQRCAKSEGGLSCPTVETLAAMQRARMLPTFVRFACAHPAPTGPESNKGAAAQPAAAAILVHLDLTSFANSTGPRRQPGLRSPGDYGLSKVESFDDGWTQVSRPDGGWFMSALMLDGSSRAATICFVDAGGKGARYHTTEVLQVQRQPDARWTAVQSADRYDCRTNPPRRSAIGSAPSASSGAPTFIPYHTMPPQ